MTAHILVVEDEVIVAEDIKNSLKNLGYDPMVVHSGKEALRKAEEFRPDLVLMDIVLDGEMDGVETANIIRSKYGIPVVYLTAYSDDATVERAKITEPYGYIIKPFRERELHINIEIALYKHRMEKMLKESREWFIKTLKSISDAVIATDSNGLIRFMNPSAQSLTGWRFDEAKGRPLKEVFNIISENGENNIVTMVEQEGVLIEQTNQTLLVTKHGKKIPIDDTGDPIRDEEGNILGFVVVFRERGKR